MTNLFKVNFVQKLLQLALISSSMPWLGHWSRGAFCCPPYNNAQSAVKLYECFPSLIKALNMQGTLQHVHIHQQDYSCIQTSAKTVSAGSESYIAR